MRCECPQARRRFPGFLRSRELPVEPVEGGRPRRPRGFGGGEAGGEVGEAGGRRSRVLPRDTRERVRAGGGCGVGEGGAKRHLGGVSRHGMQGPPRPRGGGRENDEDTEGGEQDLAGGAYAEPSAPGSPPARIRTSSSWK